ncbi:MAG: DMT family transporter [Candidatus Competibacteraceae bacterium]
MNETRRGILLALLAAALFGAGTPVAKSLLAEVGPTTLAGLLYLGTGIGLAAFSALRILFGFRRREAPLRLQDWPWLAGAVLTGGIVGPILLMVGLTTTPAANASLLLNLESLFTWLLAWIVFRESVNLRVGVGALVILSGGLVLSWQGRVEAFNPGALAIAGACLAWGIDNNLTRKLAAADPVILVMIKGTVAGPCNLLIAATLGESMPTLAPAILGGAVGMVGYGLSLICFVLALRSLGTARTGAYFATAPFLGAVLAVTVFGEAPSLQLAGAGVLMLVGVLLHLTERHEHEHEHKALRHTHRHRHDEHHRHEHAVAVAPGAYHVHEHAHAPMVHKHPHFPDIHHRHAHGGKSGNGR